MSEPVINLWHGTELSAACGVTFNVRTARVRGENGTGAVDMRPGPYRLESRVESIGSTGNRPFVLSRLGV
ncbi:hypothetical protein SAMN05661010_02368 [Modicisalibacter muralis]|uniref:Uncharacterized protein n=1 Tax=Modicisalibacter muralis TaxID=119000 RepID=A0A1G9M9P6_9GAMM|nr:hypothetical protein SAMN05661010_02368 [Halomonas muralis]